jgi:adenylate cyclase
MPYKLISAEGDQAFELKGATTLVVGRALNSDIPVFDPTISRRHAELTAGAEGVLVRDLGSSNGTFVNGAAITDANAVPGDVVTFGKVAFHLREAPAERTSAAVSTSSVRTGEAADASPPRMAGTIVRQLPVAELRGLTGVLRGEGQVLRLTPEGASPAVADATAAAEEAHRIGERLRLLLEVSKALSRAAEVDELMDKVAGICFDIFDVDGVSIELTDERGELVPRVARDRKGLVEGRRIPRSIARTSIEQRAGILSDNAGEDTRFGGHSVLMQRVRSTMCAPLVGSEGSTLGVLYVDNLTTTHRFHEADLDFLIAFAGIVGVAVENSRFSERIRREALVRANFERYFSPNLAARIADSPDAVKLTGDKRPIAVLFSDIRGFTSLAETMNPDEMARHLTEYFTEMVECVFRHGGTLDKFIGDAVMAQWGAPLGAADDADRAMSAALDMMRELRALNVRWATEGRPMLEIGIGLNFGEAFAGNIGSERRLEYTVIGDVVNTASRLCSAAGPGEILLSDEMRRALTAPPSLDVCPPMELKGKSQLVPVYLVRR